MHYKGLKKNIEVSVDNLLQLTGICCWNKISNNISFILSDFNEFDRKNFFEQRDSRKRINSSKQPISFELALEFLNNNYHDLYDVTLYIFRALKRETIIEIQYYRKSNFDSDYFAVVKDNPPMFHAKISKPNYIRGNEKFDVNWELGGIREILNNFLFRFKRVNLNY